MIQYLIYTTASMGLLLLFYHVFLAKEKTYQINRYYLLISLLFSLAVPFIPIGMTGFWLGFANSPELSQKASISTEDAIAKPVNRMTSNLGRENSTEKNSTIEWIYAIIFWAFMVITFFMLCRLIWHLYRMRLRTLMNPAASFEGLKVVLLDEDIVPHTFGKTIFVNKGRFENSEISKEVMTHEFIHASQNHSLDILFIEILKAVGWFNPVLYFYKTAIQLNHEYIADEKVLSRGADVADYQALLLQTQPSKPVHYLSTSFNFKTTKKRFIMMTKNNITARSYLKMAFIIPLFLILSVTFGCNPIKPQKDQREKIVKMKKGVNVKLVNARTLKINGKPVPFSKAKPILTNIYKEHPKAIVNIKMNKNATSRLLTKLQTILQKAGALRINYSTIQSNATQTEKTQTLELNKSDILRLYINKEGNIFVNQNRTALSSVKGLVEKFITNNGKSGNLSQSPQKAVISIKTDKETPYDIYTHAIDKVVEAYNELRNRASEKLFGKPFQTLKKGSKQRKGIENMYPKRISIAKPSNS